MLENFMLTKSSPLIDKGISIQDNGGKDLFGNPLKGEMNIGVHEF